jgi:hypothetical protein
MLSFAAAVLAVQVSFDGGVDPLTTAAMIMVGLAYWITLDD